MSLLSNIFIDPGEIHLVQEIEPWIQKAYQSKVVYKHNCFGGKTGLTCSGGMKQQAETYLRSKFGEVRAPETICQNFPHIVWTLFQGRFKETVEAYFGCVIKTKDGPATHFQCWCSDDVWPLISSFSEELANAFCEKDLLGLKCPEESVEFDGLVDQTQEPLAEEMKNKWSSTFKKTIVEHLRESPLKLDYEEIKQISMSNKLAETMSNLSLAGTSQATAAGDLSGMASNFSGTWQHGGAKHSEQAGTSSAFAMNSLQEALDDRFPENVQKEVVTIELVFAWIEENFVASVREEDYKDASVLYQYCSSIFPTLKESDFKYFLTRYPKTVYRGKGYGVLCRHMKEAATDPEPGYANVLDYIDATKKNLPKPKRGPPNMSAAKILQQPLQKVREYPPEPAYVSSPAMQAPCHAESNPQTVTYQRSRPRVRPPFVFSAGNTTMNVASCTNEQLLDLDMTLLPAEHKTYRAIILDGCNLAVSHGCGTGGEAEFFSCRGIATAVRMFYEWGHRKIYAYVPKKYIYNNGKYPVKDPIENGESVFSRLKRLGILKVTMSSSNGRRTCETYDDREILQMAIALKGVVISNDQFRDLECEASYSCEKWRRLGFSFTDDIFMIQQDPTGRDGTVARFLRFAEHEIRPASPSHRRQPRLCDHLPQSLVSAAPPTSKYTEFQLQQLQTPSNPNQISTYRQIPIPAQTLAHPYQFHEFSPDSSSPQSSSFSGGLEKILHDMFPLEQEHIKPFLKNITTSEMEMHELVDEFHLAFTKNYLRKGFMDLFPTEKEVIEKFLKSLQDPKRYAGCHVGQLYDEFITFLSIVSEAAKINSLREHLMKMFDGQHKEKIEDFLKTIEGSERHAEMQQDELTNEFLDSAF